MKNHGISLQKFQTMDGRKSVGAGVQKMAEKRNMLNFEAQLHEKNPEMAKRINSMNM